MEKSEKVKLFLEQVAKEIKSNSKLHSQYEWVKHVPYNSLYFDLIIDTPEDSEGAFKFASIGLKDFQKSVKASIDINNGYVTQIIVTTLEEENEEVVYTDKVDFPVYLAGINFFDVLSEFSNEFKDAFYENLF